jgi:hypothetical protein
MRPTEEKSPAKSPEEFQPPGNQGFLFLPPPGELSENGKEGMIKPQFLPREATAAIGILPALEPHLIPVIDCGRTRIREEKGRGQNHPTCIPTGQG